MKYKTFRINVFEQASGKWRARITRADRRPLQLSQFATSVDHASAVEAMTKAMEMIDVLSVPSNIERTPEKHWRCLSKADRKLGAV